MIDYLVLVGSIAVASTLQMWILRRYFKNKLPELINLFEEKAGDLIQAALDGVGGQLQAAFTDPMIKRAMSVLGEKSGEVRHDAALRNRVADKVTEQSPVIKKLCDYFGVTPLEGLQLLNDPLIQPLVQGFLQGQGGNNGGGLLPGFTANPEPRKGECGSVAAR